MHRQETYQGNHLGVLYPQSCQKNHLRSSTDRHRRQMRASTRVNVLSQYVRAPLTFLLPISSTVMKSRLRRPKVMYIEPQSCQVRPHEAIQSPFSRGTNKQRENTSQTASSSPAQEAFARARRANEALGCLCRFYGKPFIHHNTAYPMESSHNDSFVPVPLEFKYRHLDWKMRRGTIWLSHTSRQGYWAVFMKNSRS